MRAVLAIPTMCVAAQAITLVLSPAGAISGPTGDTVGCGFTIANSSGNWIEITSANFCSGSSGVSTAWGDPGLGTFADIVSGHNDIVAGPDPDSPSAPQPFSARLDVQTTSSWAPPPRRRAFGWPSPDAWPGLATPCRSTLRRPARPPRRKPAFRFPLRPCVFFWPSSVCIDSMNVTACYFADTMADENTEIARGLRRSDPGLLDSLIEKYQHRLLRYLVHLTGRRELAEDIFQETWMRVLERGRQYDGRHEFGAWLYAIARNLAIDDLRRRRPATLVGLENGHDAAPCDLPAAGLPSALDLTMRRERSEQISAGMQHIAAEYREVLVLRFQEELSLQEIAGVTGAPLSTVKSRIYRGLGALQQWLKGARS